MMTTKGSLKYRLQCGCVLDDEKQIVIYCNRHKMNNTRLSKTRSGTVCKITVVHFTGIILGSGWIFTCQHGGMDKPVLISNNGESMEEGWYTLQINTEQILALISDRIH